MNQDQEIERRSHPENFLNYNPDEIQEDNTSLEEKLEALENI